MGDAGGRRLNNIEAAAGRRCPRSVAALSGAEWKDLLVGGAHWLSRIGRPLQATVPSHGRSQRCSQSRMGVDRGPSWRARCELERLVIRLLPGAPLCGRVEHQGPAPELAKRCDALFHGGWKGRWRRVERDSEGRYRPAEMVVVPARARPDLFAREGSGAACTLWKWTGYCTERPANQGRRGQLAECK